MLSAALCSEVIAGPRVDIVIGEKAPALERLAADELSGQLKRVYEADVKIGSTAPPDAPHVIFVGSPDTNASMKPFADSWPSGNKKLTDQGHLLRSVTHNNKPALLIGGGSPVATYWAVAEFGHRLGVRSMLFGDLDPVSPPEFKLDGFDIVLEPQHREREWHFRNRGPMDSGSWGLEEHRRFLRQLAKLKFNRVSVNVRASQPFVHFEFDGVKRGSEQLWGPKGFPVAGDTAGRKVFGGARIFENPSFADAKTYSERIAAGTKHLNGIIDAAHAGGMTVRLHVQPDWFPGDFGRFLTQANPQGSDGPHVISEPSAFLRDQRTQELARTQIQAYLSTYPELDIIDLEFNSSISDEQFRRIFPDPNLWRRSNGNFVGVLIDGSRFPAKSFEPFVKLPDQQTVPSAAVRRIKLGENGYEFLPNCHSDLPKELQKRSPQRGKEFAIDAVGVSDLDVATYWLSRVSFDEAIGFEDACRELIDPVCGNGVSERVLAAFALSHEAGRQMQGVDFGGVFRGPINLQDIADIVGEKPASISIASDHYLNAMNEMYRANTRAREGGRAFTLYWARRFEFAFEFLNFAQAVGKAKDAKAANDPATQIAELEKAIESLNNALNAMAAVARSNSDRGLIAVLNEYGYRPLKKKLAEAEAAAK